ncbi:uncharacterized protein LOC126764613 [Bactrocera neohumeralis]|uniref:uncharacterized protein LOC120780747 n=1 Tax=Bactrocera tryoni TaxID=59916 RepID=UPI001A979046|nr:uncharacterized protein LOC120780747 [Bactrocera tryoni]XP_050338236.1 uncharacterized protein LOC126764613 [Bactrocera neohumeralis]
MFSYFKTEMEITSRILVVLLLLSKKVNGSKRSFIEPYSMTPEAVPIITTALLECSKKLKENNREQLENYQQIRRHLLVNIRVNPSFNLKKVDQFLILDEIFDAKQRSKAKIMSPYLIEISRGEPVMMYPLEFSESLKLNDSNRTQLIDDISQNSQNGTSSNQIRKVQKFKSGDSNYNTVYSS